MRDRIRFLLGDQPRELKGVDPTMTVLEWLRTVERRTGTKEGCAEGDCGACTVVVGRPAGAGMRYQAINACIQFLPMLDGCQLLTVEDLSAPDGRLHPVQQAMVDCHASQCGFCTPGFVMSLFALYRHEKDPNEQRIDDVLAGNLCRCTGYAPIVAAARQMYALDQAADGRLAAQEAKTVAALRALQDEETIAILHDGRRFFAPASVDALAGLLLEHPAACIVAGATDVGLWVTKAQRRLDPVIWIGRVRELQRLVETESAIEIGAAVTYSEAAPLLARAWPDFGELLRRLGGVQIRNAGTIGGNIANGSPIGDTPPALIALGARLHLRRGEERRVLPVEDFFIDYGRQDRRPGEFVEKIVLPGPEPGARFCCYKISKRFDQDISAVCGAFHLKIEDGRVADVRIAYGGMAAIPKRARECERALLGQSWTRATIEAGMAALGSDFSPITDWRASADYRAQVARNLLRKLFIETSEKRPETRVVGSREPADG